MPATPPIFILSSERSGTNLLRAIMSAHSRIASPPPCGLVMGLKPAIETIAPEDRARTIDIILHYAIALTQSHMNAWDPEPTIEEVKRHLCDTTDFWGIFRAVNTAYLTHQEADHWLTKEPGLIRFPGEILSAYPGAQIIYLVRDGRDVAMSMTKKKLHANDVRSAISRWGKEQRIMLDFLAQSKDRERIHVLRYEDLTTAPKKNLSPILKALDLEFEDAQLEYYVQKETIRHAESSVFWKELANPISSSNFGKYLKSLSQREIELCESEAGQELRDLGYECHFERPRPITRLELLRDKIRQRGRHIEEMSEEERARRKEMETLMREIRDFAKEKNLAARISPPCDR